MRDATQQFFLKVDGDFISVRKHVKRVEYVREDKLTCAHSFTNSDLAGFLQHAAKWRLEYEDHLSKPLLIEIIPDGDAARVAARVLGQL